MRDYINIAEQHGRNMIGFQCRSVSLKGEKRVWENMDNFWKRFLIKWDPKLHYGAIGGQVHEFVGGITQNIWDPGTGGSKQAPLIYEHRKQENDIWRKGFRNMYCGGGGPNGKHAHINDWHELRELCSQAGYNNWNSFYQYLLGGNIAQPIKDWMIRHRQDNWGDGASEFREAFKTYFRLLHPEEEPEEFRGEHIQ